MTQIHKRFGTEQVKALLQQYCQGTMTRAEVEDILDISKSRFFILLAAYRRDPAQFSVSYERSSPQRLSSAIEAALEHELRREKGLIEDRRLPISDYNYSAVRDRLAKEGLTISLSTVIDRAKRLDCYKPPHKTKAHDREVITAAIGALIQHDASHHLWSPYALGKWALITSIDDFSRKLLFADFFAEETTWAHIQSAQRLIQQYGIPFRYYVDSLRVFRFVRERDSMYYKNVLRTDEADPQWRQVMRLMNVDITYALSRRPKGRLNAPIAGFRTGSCAPALSRKSATSPRSARCCATRWIGTTITRFTPRQRKSRVSASTGHVQPGRPCSAPSVFPSRTGRQKTCFAYTKHGS